jgi:hypothetical protein
MGARNDRGQEVKLRHAVARGRQVMTTASGQGLPCRARRLTSASPGPAVTRETRHDRNEPGPDSCGAGIAGLGGVVAAWPLTLLPQ